MQSWLRSIGVNVSAIYEVPNNGGKYGWRRSTLNIRCKPRKGGSVELKIIVSYILGDSVRPIAKWMELLMGPCKEFFLQM
jgi:hypothetical protein